MGRVFDEDETFGAFMAGLADTELPNAERLVRMDRVLRAIEVGAASTADHYGYVLERFHPSYYALLPESELYARFDRAIESLGGLVVLLGFQAERAEQRAIDRVDRRETDWTASMVAYYGSREALRAALATSQQRRHDYLRRGRLPWLAIDTTAMDWDGYAEQIVDFWRAPLVT